MHASEHGGGILLMRLVKQKHTYGCGIAAVAMLTGRPYDFVMNLYRGLYNKSGYYGTSTHELHYLLLLLGYDSPQRMLSFRSRHHRDLEVDAILKIPFEITILKPWHWVVWDATRCRILDPYKYFNAPKLSPVSYLPVRKFC